MDPLLDLLRGLRLTGGVFLDAEFSAPWCVATRVGPDEYSAFFPRPSHVIAYHYVAEGRCELAVDGEPAVELQAGEIGLLTRNDPHRLGSTMTMRAVPARQLLAPAPGGGLARIVHGGGGEKTRVFCGFLGTAAADPPIARVLPAALKVRVEPDSTGLWIESSFRYAARELASGSESTPALLARLAELLLIEAVRRHVDTAPVDGGWVAGLRDPIVGRALALVHGRSHDPWTVPALAREAGASRSVFAQRFTTLMGETPMRYLARQRLRVAAEHLRTTARAVATIALEVGYASEAAFSRAFKREFGQSPAAWRKRGPDGAS